MKYREKKDQFSFQDIWHTHTLSSSLFIHRLCVLIEYLVYKWISRFVFLARTSPSQRHRVFIQYDDNCALFIKATIFRVNPTWINSEYIRHRVSEYILKFACDESCKARFTSSSIKYIVVIYMLFLLYFLLQFFSLLAIYSCSCA